SRVADAVRTEGVGSNWDVPAASFVDGSAQLGDAELRPTDVRARRHPATSGHDLEARGAGLQLASGRRADARFVVDFETQKVAVTAGDGDRRACREDARTVNQPVGDRIPKAERHSASTAQVADSGDAGGECLARSRDAAQQKPLIVFHTEVAEWVRPGA